MTIAANKDLGMHHYRAKDKGTDDSFREFILKGDSVFAACLAQKGEFECTARATASADAVDNRTKS